MNRTDIVGTQIGAALLEAERTLKRADGGGMPASVRGSLREVLGVLRIASAEAYAREVEALCSDMDQTPDDESGARAGAWIATLERLRQRVEVEGTQPSGEGEAPDMDRLVANTLAALGARTTAAPSSDSEPLRAARAQYERALLQALTGAEGGGALMEMGEALDRFEAHFAGTSDAGFWMVVTAALDVVRGAAGGFDADAKRFCAALNLALRRVLDGSVPTDPALAYAALGLIARGTASGGRMDKVRAAALAAGLPDPELEPALRDQCAKRIAAASEALDRLFAGETEALSEIEAEVSEFESLCVKAGARGLTRLAADLGLAVRAWHGRKATVRDGTTVALALLLAERSVRNTGATGTPLRQALAAMAATLKAMGNGAVDAGLPEGVSAHAAGFDRASVAAAGTAMRGCLASTEAALESYFQAPGDAAGLTPLKPVFAEIAGTLAMLGAAHAERTARQCAAAIANLAQTGGADRDAFERIAEQVAALAAFVDALVRDGNAREDDHPFCCSAATAPDAALPDSGTEAPASDGKEQPSRLPEWIERPGDPELAAIFIEEAREVLAGLETALATGPSAFEERERAIEARRGFHTLKGSGRMVGLERFAQAAWCVEEVLNAWLEHDRGSAPDLVRLARAARVRSQEWIEAFERDGEACIDVRVIETWAGHIKRGEPLADEIDAADTVPRRGADAPATKAAALANLSTNLYAIFTEEAARHIAALREELGRCRELPDGLVTHEFMLAAHTLASACATMRLPAPSELGGALEDLLVDLLRADCAPMPAQMDLIETSIDALERMVGEAVARRSPGTEPALRSALMAARDALALSPAGQAADAAVPKSDGPDRGPYHWAAGSRRRFRPRDELDTQLLPVFLEEAQDIVPQIGTGLRRWRAQPTDAAFAHELLRELHTLKGSARMAGAMGLGELAHAMETRVEHAIAHNATTPEWFDAMETSFDRLILLLDEVADNRDADKPPSSEAATPTQDLRDELTAPLPTETTRPMAGQELEGHARAALRIRADVLDRIVNQSGEVGIARARAETEVQALKAQMRELADNVIRLRAQLRDLEIHAESQLQATTTLGADLEQSFDPLEFDRFTRFQELTRMMAESLSDVTVVQQTIHKNVDDVSAALSAQAVLSRDLQQELMRVRMVPFSSIAERLHRVVRQSAKELGKRANLDIHGLHSELDRVVLERITAPLEHLLRNAVSHGLELPEARIAAGKPAMGTIVIDVRQENNEIVLTHRDDGAGIDPARIRARAFASGLADEAAGLSDAEATELIFLPGFSTAERVTQLAGRGVGLDVVRTEVKALGGRVAVNSQVGEGTAFTMHLPLTLSVARVLLVGAGAHMFALPAGMVEQVLLLPRTEIDTALDAGSMTWRGGELSFRYLPRLFGAAEAIPEVRKRYPVMVLRAGESAMAVLVDSVTGSRDIVLKNLGPQLTRLPGLIGASILPGGEIALLINPLQLQASSADVRAPSPAAVAVTSSHALSSVMVVDDSITVRRVTHRLLSRQGYEVITAKDGLEALERLRESRPAVMLVDIEMPRMDGFELTRLVRSSSTLRDIPIIMITSRAADKHRRIARELGVDVFLGKPYSEQELLRHVQSFIRKAA